MNLSWKKRQCPSNDNSLRPYSVTVYYLKVKNTFKCPPCSSVAFSKQNTSRCNTLVTVMPCFICWGLLFWFCIVNVVVPAVASSRSYCLRMGRKYFPTSMENCACGYKSRCRVWFPKGVSFPKAVKAACITLNEGFRASCAFDCTFMDKDSELEELVFWIWTLPKVSGLWAVAVKSFISLF